MSSASAGCAKRVLNWAILMNRSVVFVVEYRAPKLTTTAAAGALAS